MQRLGCPQLDLVGAGPDLLLILLLHKVEKLMPQQQLGNIQLAGQRMGDTRLA